VAEEDEVGKGHNPSVRIRMYRQGLGDCFLLTFSEDGKQEFNMMIDCGLLQGTENGKEIMRQVVADIEQTLKQGGAATARLDAVVLTHEHADHISGFNQASDVFANIEFDEVWAAWVDDETHPKYKLVRERFHKQVTGLRAALTQMTSAAQAGLKLSVEKLLDDFFEDDVLGAAGQSSGRPSAWSSALKKSTRPPKFFTPGTVFPLPGFDDIRIYVLGPSEDYDTFTQVNPPADDTYRSKEGPGFALLDSFVAAVGGTPLPTESFQPFERRFRIDTPTAQTEDFFKTHYGFEAGVPEEWRRINDDWLSVAGGLALKLDSYTNNTCLALAIEFISSKKVLLFPGDAQFSNWLSWQKLSWDILDADGKKEKVTTKDLLERTVLYKVGHHGSHNATLKTHGLEMMTSPDLMAIIPVDRNRAKEKKWEMPEKNLFDRLMERTRTRVILADDTDTTLKDRCKDKNFAANVSFAGTLNRTGTSPAEPICIELRVES
jgi:beta-lactamase superfamily II metal-dependent hydrolase